LNIRGYEYAQETKKDFWNEPEMNVQFLQDTSLGVDIILENIILDNY
jgi:hypothetical protein